MLDAFRFADISASGMAAERLRMEVVANNIANARSTNSANGDAYRRQHVIFREALGDGNSLGGVRVMGIGTDNSPLEKIHDPGHEHADAEGMVTLPNVKIPNEMVDLITASRSFEANLKALTTFKEMLEQTLSLLRSTR